MILRRAAHGFTKPAFLYRSYREFVTSNIYLASTNLREKQSTTYLLTEAGMRSAPSCSVLKFARQTFARGDLGPSDDHTGTLFTSVSLHGGSTESIGFSSDLPLVPSLSHLKFGFQIPDESAWLSKFERFEEWEATKCFNMHALYDSPPMACESRSFLYQGLVPKSIANLYYVKDQYDFESEQFPYIIEEALGEGGEADVFRGVCPLDGHEAAVRFIKTRIPKKKRDIYGQERELDRWFDSPTEYYTCFDYTGEYREVSILKSLSHPNIKRMTMAWAEENNICIAQEYCPTTLEKLLKSETDPWVKDNLAIGLCQGISYLESKGIVHRDVKTGNLFVDANKVLKIGDFGSAILLANQSKEAPILQGTTVSYAAPELRGSPIYTQKAEMYATGWCLFMIYLPPLCFATHQRMRTIMARMIKSNDWAVRPEQVWMASELSSIWAGNPQILYEVFAPNEANRPSTGRIVELIIDWSKKRHI